MIEINNEKLDNRWVVKVWASIKIGSYNQNKMKDNPRQTII